VMLSLGGDGTAPVSVSCLVSYTTLCGMGFVQAAVSRRLRTFASPDTPRVPSRRSSDAVQPLLINNPASGRCCAPSVSCRSSAPSVSGDGLTLPEPLRSGLAGTWLCTDLVGDFSQQMQMLGVPYLKRKVGSGLYLGVGSVICNVTVDGLSVHVEIQGRGSALLMVDGSEQEISLPDGSMGAATVCLDEGAEGAVIEARVPSRQLVIRRYLQDGKMLVDMTCQGITTTRVFSRP